jgi:integrase
LARKIRSPVLENRSSRLRLEPRKKPYTVSVARGIRLAYRRNLSGGVWSVLKSNGAGGSWLQRFALADDHEEANGSTILDFWAACDMARGLARGDDPANGLDPAVEGGRPATVGEAVAAYERDLIARDGGKKNAAWLRFHLSGTLMSKPVALLTQREVRGLRDSLIAKDLKHSTVTRFLKVFCACLTLSANDDERITNQKAWKLPALRDTANARNVILPDRQVGDVVKAAYAISDRFGAYVEILATLGVRPVQARRLVIGDLEHDHRDGARLNTPSARKGSGKKRIERTPLPIPANLALRLKALAASRAVNEPLLINDDGAPWRDWEHQRPFARAAQAAGLPKAATIYALRHSFITRSLLKGLPTRLVAAAVDSSVAMIEATYSKHIADPGADLMRGALLDFDATAPDEAKVVPIARAKADRGV